MLPLRLVPLLLLLTAIGCGESRKSAPVTGTVTLKGQPVAETQEESAEKKLPASHANGVMAVRRSRLKTKTMSLPSALTDPLQA